MPRHTQRFVNVGQVLDHLSQRRGDKPGMISPIPFSIQMPIKHSDACDVQPDDVPAERA